MKNVTVADVKTWPVVKLIRGIKLTYKNRSMYFPNVYLGPSEMDDYDHAAASIEVKEVSDDRKQIVAQRKAMTLCSRVILNEGYLDDPEQIEMQLQYALRERARRKLEAKIAESEDEFLSNKLAKDLEALPELPRPVSLFPDEEVLSFGISSMSGSGTLPVDNGRLTSAYQRLNYFEQEEVEDFLFLPSN